MKIRRLRFVLAHVGDERLRRRRPRWRAAISLGRLVDLLPAELGLDRHDDVEALAAGRLDERHEAERFQHALTCTAASTTSRQAMPSPGSRSKTIRSGFSSRSRNGAPAVELDDAELGQRQIALGVLDREIGLVLAVASSASRSVATDGGMPVKAWRWKKQSCGRPVGQRTSDTGRPRMCGSMKSPTSGVVDGDVELGRPRLAEQPPGRDWSPRSWRDRPPRSAACARPRPRR